MDTMLNNRAEEAERINAETRERLIFFINVAVVSGRTRYIYLEQRYGIAARKWKNVCNRVQFPTIGMLSSIINHYPNIATWLMTGSTTSQEQIDPTLNLIKLKE